MVLRFKCQISPPGTIGFSRLHILKTHFSKAVVFNLARTKGQILNTKRVADRIYRQIYIILIFSFYFILWSGKVNVYLLRKFVL
jgi:hypothetical protein